MTSITSPETQSGPQPGGLLSRLPSELRLQIYEMILLKERKVKVFAGDYVAILASCHMIHDEARPVLYMNTSFDISCSLRFRRESGIGLLMAKISSSDDVVIDKKLKIQRIRNLSLNILLAKEAPSSRWGETWLHHLATNMGTSSDLATLHVRLRTDSGDRVNVQEQADHILTLLAKLKCKGRITAAVDPSLERLGFKPESYFTMLCKEEG
jgi:hypothetical protein